MHALFAGGFVAIGFLAAIVGARETSNREVLALSGAAVLSAAVAVVALTNFRAAVIGLLAARASLDSLHHASHLDPATALGGLFIVMALFWLAARSAAGRMRPVSGTAVALLGVALVGMVSAFSSTSPTTALSAAARIAAGGLMVVVLEQFVADDPTMAPRLWLTALASAAVPIAMALYQWSHHEGAFVDSSGFSRISGTFVHPDSFATYLGMALVVAYTLYAARWRRIVAVAIFGAGLFALFLTYSRGGWIAAAFAVVVVTWRSKRKLVVPLAACVAGAALFVPSVTHRLTDIRHGPRANGTPTNSLSWRFEYWQQTFVYFRTHPLTGIGLDSVQRVNPEGVEPHNFVLQAAEETGLMGLAALAILILLVVRDLRRASRSIGRKNPVVLIAIGATIVVLIQALVTNVITEGVIYWYWAALVAPALAYASQKRSLGPQ